MELLGRVLKELGAPIIGEVVGGVTKSPTLGGYARRGLEIAAEALGVPAEEAAVREAISANPILAADKLRDAEAINANELSAMAEGLRLENQLALEAQRAEIEHGPASWAWRRTITTYGLLFSFLAPYNYAFFKAAVDGDLTTIMTLVPIGAAAWGGWMAVTSGTKGLTEMMKARSNK